MQSHLYYSGNPDTIKNCKNYLEYICSVEWIKICFFFNQKGDSIWNLTLIFTNLLYIWQVFKQDLYYLNLYSSTIKYFVKTLISIKIDCLTLLNLFFSFSNNSSFWELGKDRRIFSSGVQVLIFVTRRVQGVSENRVNTLFKHSAGK